MKLPISRLAREPLFQFLFVALILFGGERLINADDYANAQFQISIDDETLVQFMQLRAKTFKPEEAIAALKALSPTERQRLIDDYARAEVLFREAMILNLDKNDQIIRRRLIQKMDYLAQGFYDESVPLTDADLQTYYNQHRQDYQKAAEATFTHVFISSERRSVDEAKARVNALQQELNRTETPFENAARHGERFLYNRNYVNRQDDEISSHFGSEFQQQVFVLSPSDRWQGPIQSNFGWHLVLLVKNTPAYIPELVAIGSAVFADTQRQQQRSIKRQAIAKLMAKYQITDKSQ